jgi:hypothetical protein
LPAFSAFRTSACAFADLSLSLARSGFVNAAWNTHYTPFGVIVPKDWLFAQGGLPVIYQPDDKFLLLPESLRWRHVTFSLGKKPVDFTWEQEWRIQCEWLALDPSVVTLIVPHQTIVEQLLSDHQQEQDFQIQLYSTIMDDRAELYRQDFEWGTRPLY